MIDVKQFAFNHYIENSYLLTDTATGDCALVDPGMTSDAEEKRLNQYLLSHALKLKLVLLTHAHVDHIAGLRRVCERYNLPVALHRDGWPLLRQAPTYGIMMGFGQVDDMSSLNTRWVEDDEVLPLGESRIEARWVPGHCPGSLCFVLHDERLVVSGDALFRMSIGRTDLPDGDYDLLTEKIRSRLMCLEDDYQVLPGHGELTTIGDERRSNPFF